MSVSGSGGGGWDGGTKNGGRCAVGSAFGLLIGLLVSCANPQAPSGGPRDSTPPSVVQTRPVQDTVDVSTDVGALRVEFSEYVERSTLSQALSITPTFEQRPQFSWDGRAVEIQFPSALRDSTTYIFTFGTTLSDARGVSLETPITVAFSTGERINRGQIEGRVVNGPSGTTQQGVDVFAYALPPGASAVRPLPDAPSYRTQTGEGGRFSFDYMREGPYYVLALRDNNRNRQPDPQEPVAVPPRLSIRADSGAAAVPVPWLLARRDTTAPQLQQVRPVSRQRLRLRFDEPVRLGTRAPTAWAPRDSATGTPVAVRGVYNAPDRPNAIVVRTAPMPDARHALPLRRGAVVDTLGQPLRPDTARFRAAARADTLRTEDSCRPAWGKTRRGRVPCCRACSRASDLIRPRTARHCGRGSASKTPPAPPSLSRSQPTTAPPTDFGPTRPFRRGRSSTCGWRGTYLPSRTRPFVVASGALPAGCSARLRVGPASSTRRARRRRGEKRTRTPPRPARRPFVPTRLGPTPSPPPKTRWGPSGTRRLRTRCWTAARLRST